MPVGTPVAVSKSIVHNHYYNRSRGEYRDILYIRNNNGRKLQFVVRAFFLSPSRFGSQFNGSQNLRCRKHRDNIGYIPGVLLQGIIPDRNYIRDYTRLLFITHVKGRSEDYALAGANRYPCGFAVGRQRRVGGLPVACRRFYRGIDRSEQAADPRSGRYVFRSGCR